MCVPKTSETGVILFWEGISALGNKKYGGERIDF